ncbi:hypothetical protein [Ligilactobacillus salivarius]
MEKVIELLEEGNTIPFIAIQLLFLFF